MSPRTLIRNLFYSPLPAVLAYSSIMFIGSCLAGAEKKTATVAASAVVSNQITKHGITAKSARFKNEIAREKK